MNTEELTPHDGRLEHNNRTSPHLANQARRGPPGAGEEADEEVVKAGKYKSRGERGARHPTGEGARGSESNQSSVTDLNLNHQRRVSAPAGLGSRELMKFAPAGLSPRELMDTPLAGLSPRSLRHR